MNPNIPEKCNGCGKPLLLESLYVDDGCPCNTPRGVNFTPKHCDICGTEDCVKPGHRLKEVFGFEPACPECRGSGQFQGSPGYAADDNCTTCGGSGTR